MDSARGAAEAVGDHPVVERGARLGYAANGLLHLVIAWIALRIAWASSFDDADQSGALRALADTPVGGPLLWTVAAGFALLAVWQVIEALVRHDTMDRVKAAAKGVVYVALVVTTVNVLRGGGSSSSEQTQSATAEFMTTTGGRVFVGAVGLAVIGVGGYHVVKGIRKSFVQDLQEHPGAWAVHAGRFGYVAKGIALALVGGLFVFAAATARAEEATGLDGALRTVLEVPLGPVLLTVVALGLAAYGVYSFARARYARL